MTLYYADPQVEANVALKSRTVSGEEVPGHDVISLPGTVASDINASSGFLSSLVSLMTTLAGSVTSSRVAVDLTSTITTYLANLTNIATYLSTLQGAITSSRMAVNVDSTTTGKLDTLHTDLSPPTVYYEDGKTVSSAGTRVAIAASQALTHGVWVFAKESNVGLIFAGGVNVSSTKGGRLVPGAPLWFDAANLANVYVDAATSGDGVTYLGW